MITCHFRDSWNKRCENPPDVGQICNKHKFTFDDIRERKLDKICIYNRWDDFGTFRCDNGTINNHSLCPNCYGRIKSKKNNRDFVKSGYRVRYDPYDRDNPKNHHNVEKELQLESIDKELLEYGTLTPLFKEKTSTVPVDEFIPIEKQPDNDNTKKAIDFLNTIQTEYDEKKRLFNEYQDLMKRINKTNEDLLKLMNLQLEVVNLNQKKEQLEDLMKSALSKTYKSSK